ncbi:hypothetical protein H2200_000023 [Cladophialophora chaetospira]|uniref:Uncharacterized protein n=1 Tax=Cladophialophora chaetospira TaxID=386627 RepID=A0AA38XMM1_9EURO|nr:hypothetical protein H2200_000023 [Cladophialophora chaetospira]
MTMEISTSGSELVNEHTITNATTITETTPSAAPAITNTKVYALVHDLISLAPRLAPQNSSEEDLQMRHNVLTQIVNELDSVLSADNFERSLAESDASEERVDDRIHEEMRKNTVRQLKETTGRLETALKRYVSAVDAVIGGSERKLVKGEPGSDGRRENDEMIDPAEAAIELDEQLGQLEELRKALV